VSNLPRDEVTVDPTDYPYRLDMTTFPGIDKLLGITLGGP